MVDRGDLEDGGEVGKGSGDVGKAVVLEEQVWCISDSVISVPRGARVLDRRVGLAKKISV